MQLTAIQWLQGSLITNHHQTDPENPGKRRFLVSTYGDFWNKYRSVVSLKLTERLITNASIALGR